VETESAERSISAENGVEGNDMVIEAMSKPRIRQTATRLFEKEDIPKGLEWVAMLSPLNYRLFIIDLYAALAKAAINRESVDALYELLEDWKATAEVDANPDLAARLKTPRDKRTYREWKCG
jgi:hypothetical protein